MTLEPVPLAESDVSTVRTSPAMTLELVPMDESDVSTMMNIVWEAHGERRFIALYPNGRTPQTDAHQIQRILAEWREHPDCHKYMKVLDTALPDDDPFGKMVGHSHWEMHPHERTDADLAEQRKKRETPPDPPPGLNVEASKAVGKHITDAKEMLVGAKPHVYLAGLSTRPSYHRKGVASLHMRWGLEHADRLGLPATLVASPMATPLYKKFGFEIVAPFTVDPEIFGADSLLNGECMYRPARPVTAA